MEITYDTLLSLFEINCLVQGFPATNKQAQAIFIPGRAAGDWEDSLNNVGLLSEAVYLSRFLRSNPAPVVITGFDGSYDSQGQRVATGYPGYHVWQQELTWRGIDASHIIVAPPLIGEEKKTHTRAETNMFVQLAKQQQWQTALLLAYPHQFPRLYGHLLKSFQDIGYFLEVVPRAPTPHRWDIPVYGSLGEKQLPREGHIKEELDRILKYIAQSLMVPLSEVRTYLQNLHRSVHAAPTT
ncbi:MAG: hypothetical protein WD972_00430 [Candidatus Andersenbacteria bacterium]